MKKFDLKQTPRVSGYNSFFHDLDQNCKLWIGYTYSMNIAECLIPSAVQWEQSLIDKYDSRGPRYTSYPTANLFTPDYQETHYLKAVDEMREHVFEALSLYVHIPFCQDICYYCACNKVVTRNKQAADEYLDHLEKEMQIMHEHLGKKRKVLQLHLGGGSPTFLDAGQMTRLISMLSTYFNLVDDEKREYSIEIDPRTVTSETLALLKGLGFNRISLGVQDFSPEVQEAVNRKNSFAMVEDLVVAARDYGYHSINIDLIYGLPKQSLQSLGQTVEQVIKLSPDRIAFYNYAHLPDRFTSQRAIDRQQLPTASEKLDMLNLISQLLTDAGYIYLGMDHFVKPDDSLALALQDERLQRNFQGYSTVWATNLVGLGVSSISSGEGYFAQNAKDLTTYYQMVEEGHLPIEKGLIVSEDDLMRRDVIMPLIGKLHVNIKVWEKKYHKDFFGFFHKEINKLKDMEKDGLVKVSEDEIEVTIKGRAMLRPICTIFDKYHQQNTQIFSKMI